MSDEKDPETASLVPFAAGEIVVRSASLVKRGLEFLEASHPTDDEIAYAFDNDVLVTSLRAEANAGEVNSQVILGQWYALGLSGLPQDDAQAVALYRKAADQGHADAQFNLGYAYAYGQGVPQDYAQAVAWYRKAADQGNAHAQNNLGHAYRNGQGVPQDYGEAVAWYRKAAEQGNQFAQFNLGYAYNFGQGVPQDSAQAVCLIRFGGRFRYAA